jgi:rsbT antagonist protein RsbS
MSEHIERIPILALGDVLLVSIQVDLHDRLALELQDSLTERIAQSGASGVIIDISLLDTVDSFMARMLANLASMARLLDAEVVLAGMQPAVAMTLVELGLSLPGIRTALNVDSGLAALRPSPGAGSGRGQADARGL